MTYQPTTISDGPSSLPQLPGWVTSSRAETQKTAAFRSGAGLMVLDWVVGDHDYGVPMKLLANRMAPTTAAATSKLESRLARRLID